MPDGRPAHRPRVARNLALLSRAAARHAEDDPMLLAVQTLRRLPGGLRRRIAALLGAGSVTDVSVRAALGHFLADHPEEARRVLERLPRRRANRRLADELAVALGGPAPEGAAPTVRSRAAWHRGDITEALGHVSSSSRRGTSRYAAQLASERDLLTPGFRLPAAGEARRNGSRRADATEPSGIRALHLLTNSLPWTQSGYSLRSHAILRAQSDAGIAVEAVTRTGYPVIVGLPQATDTDVVDGVTYRRTLPARLADTQTGRLEQLADTAANHAARFGATVVHTTTHYPNAIVAQAVARRLDLPWVYEVRGQLEKSWLSRRPAAEQERAALSERYVLARAREAELARDADHVVVISQALLEDLVSLGVPSDRMTVVPNAVDSALLAAVDPALTQPRAPARTPARTPAQAREALGLPSDGYWVGTVSSVVDYEGLDVLVRAVARLRSAGADVRCAIAGDGVARPELVRLAAALGIADAVVTPGRVPRDEALRWHQALDAFVVPRRDTEVCRTVTPLKPIEAMALGRPVIASDLPALAEIVREPATGLLTAPGDVDALVATITTLSADPDLAAELGANGRAFARTRTWQAQARTYRTIYERLGASG